MAHIRNARVNGVSLAISFALFVWLSIPAGRAAVKHRAAPANAGPTTGTAIAPQSRPTPRPPAAPRTATSQPAALEIKYTQFTLPNGLHVILHEDHSIPIVNVNVLYDVGSARERTGRTGFAHLFEHLMFMGSAHAAYGVFDQALEAVGGSQQRLDGNDATQYWINVPSNSLELALFPRVRSDGISPRRDDAANGGRAARCRRRTNAARAWRTSRMGSPTSRSANCCIPKGIRTTGQSSATCRT
jgi:zinc protease